MVRRVESELPQWQQYKQVPGNILNLNRGLKIYFIFTTVCVPVQYVHIKYIYFHARYKLHVHVPQVENKVRVYT